MQKEQKDQKEQTLKGWKQTLNAVLKAHNKAASTGGKAVSFATQALRSETLFAGFQELRDMGFKLNDVQGFAGRHMRALGYRWEEKGLSSSTIQNRISVFRVFAEWIGKDGMILGSENYVKNPENIKRHLVTKTDKTWSGQNQRLSDKLDAIRTRDPMVAIQLEIQRAFGLRMKEAALIKPNMADKGSYLAVNWGTKGGRDRVIPIDNDYQRDVIDRAKAMLPYPDSSMIPKTHNFLQWRNRYYHICKKEGISRKDGITSHGLRHERLNEIYKDKTGAESPIKRASQVAAEKTGEGKTKKVDKHLDNAARQEVSEVAGHSRASVAGAYLGGK